MLIFYLVFCTRIFQINSQPSTLLIYCVLPLKVPWNPNACRPLLNCIDWYVTYLTIWEYELVSYILQDFFFQAFSLIYYAPPVQIFQTQIPKIKRAKLQRLVLCHWTFWCRWSLQCIHWGINKFNHFNVILMNVLFHPKVGLEKAVDYKEDFKVNLQKTMFVYIGAT